MLWLEEHVVHDSSLLLIVWEGGTVRVMNNIMILLLPCLLPLLPFLLPPRRLSAHTLTHTHSHTDTQGHTSMLARPHTHKIAHRQGHTPDAAFKREKLYFKFYNIIDI